MDLIETGTGETFKKKNTAVAREKTADVKRWKRKNARDVDTDVVMMTMTTMTITREIVDVVKSTMMTRTSTIARDVAGVMKMMTMIATRKIVTMTGDGIVTVTTRTARR